MDEEWAPVDVHDDQALIFVLVLESFVLFYGGHDVVWILKGGLHQGEVLIDKGSAFVATGG